MLMFEMTDHSLRFTVFLHSYPEHAQWLRNASYGYWVESVEGYADKVSDAHDRWMEVRGYIGKKFPALDEELQNIVQLWDIIDQQETGV